MATMPGFRAGAARRHPAGIAPARAPFDERDAIDAVCRRHRCAGLVAVAHEQRAGGARAGRAQFGQPARACLGFQSRRQGAADTARQPRRIDVQLGDAALRATRPMPAMTPSAAAPRQRLAADLSLAAPRGATARVP